MYSVDATNRRRRRVIRMSVDLQAQVVVAAIYVVIGPTLRLHQLVELL